MDAKLHEIWCFSAERERKISGTESFGARCKRNAWSRTC